MAYVKKDLRELQVPVDEDTGAIRTTSDSSGGGGSTSDAATVTAHSVSSGATTLLLPANPNRKGFMIFSPASALLVLLGGANEAGDTAIPAGNEGCVSISNYSIRLMVYDSYESQNPLYLGPVTAVATVGTIAVMVTEFE